jgi:predicted metal-dependent hydrolase
MPTKTSLIDIDGIGPVLFKSDYRCKGLSVRIKPFEGITVMFPPGYSPRKALAFVDEKREWILRNKEKMEAHENAKTIFDENTGFCTRSFNLKIEKQARSDIRMTYENGQLKVAYPQQANVADAPIQKAIRHGIEEALRIEAKMVLPAKVHFCAEQFNFSVNRVFIKNLKSRWGSCSSVNNINLNLHLMRLPDHLIDYVVLHELCHTKEKNHGAGFWKLLDSVTGGRARQLSVEMKKYRTIIY